jgi:HK97 family phage portal protein
MGLLTRRGLEWFRARSARAAETTVLPRVALPRWALASVTNIMHGMGVRPEGARFDEAQAYVERAWVYAAARRKSILYGMPTLRVYEGDPEGDHEEVDVKHPLRALLSNPNSWQSRVDFWEDVGLFLALKGEAILALDGAPAKSASVLGQPTMISVMNPARLEARPGMANFIDQWVYRAPTGGVANYAAHEVIQIKFRNPRDEFRGLGHVKPASDAIEMEKGASAYNLAMLDNMCEPGGFIEYTGDENILTQDQMKQLIEAKEGRHRGVNRAGLLTYLMPGEAWKQAGFTPREMQYREMRQSARAEILATFGLPPVMVGIVETATYNNAVEQRKSTWEETMIPELTKMQEALNSPGSGLTWRYGETTFVKWDYSKIAALQETIDAKHMRLKDAFDRGAITRNELRQITLGLNTVPGLDDYWLSSSYIQNGTDVEAAQQRSRARKMLAPPVAVRAEVAFADVQRELAYKLAMVARDGVERRWAKHLRGALERQAARALDRFARAGTHASADTVLPQAIELREMKREVHDLVEATVLDGVRDGVREVSRIARHGNRRSLALKEARPDMDVDPNALRAIAELEQKLVQRVNATTWQRVKDDLAESASLGESVSETKDRLQITLGERRSDYECMRISRTEVGRCSNAGAVIGYRESGVVAKLEWVSTPDDRVRDSHAELDGATADIGTTVWTTRSGAEIDNGMEYPLDPNGEAEETINCRCMPLAIVSTEDEQ